MIKRLVVFLILVTTVAVGFANTSVASSYQYVKVNGTFRTIGHYGNLALRQSCYFDLYAYYNPDNGTVENIPGQKSIYNPATFSLVYIYFNGGARCPAYLSGRAFYFDKPMVNVNIQNTSGNRFFALLVNLQEEPGKPCVGVIRIQEKADIPIDVRASFSPLKLSANINNSFLQCEAFGQQLNGNLTPMFLSMGPE